MLQTILICDDDPVVRSSLLLVLKRSGYETAEAAHPAEALEYVRKQIPRLILMDMNYSNATLGEEGLELLAKVKIFAPDVPVILITAWGTINLAVRGIRGGAFDFITKPWDNRAMLKAIETAIELNRVGDTDIGFANNSTGEIFRRENIIGQSQLLMQVLNTVSRIAHTNASVLITGESGTGKELIAEAIHRNSNRNGCPFVKVNLGGISSSLFESEMFGHKKGAFTDAMYDRQGRFETADKGTILLDEIGELDLNCQVKLLRVLQDQTFESLGDSKTKHVDTRIISATNRNLPEMVAAGTFREDLFYRINLITVRVPALRERPDDIPALIRYFTDQQAKANRITPPEISLSAIEYLKKLPFYGNIRELKNLVERTILVSCKDIITDEDFREQYTDASATLCLKGDSIYSLDESEKTMILKAIDLYGANWSKIAAVLGLSRQTLYRRLEKYGINI